MGGGWAFCFGSWLSLSLDRTVGFVRGCSLWSLAGPTDKFGCENVYSRPSLSVVDPQGGVYLSRPFWAVALRKVALGVW